MNENTNAVKLASAAHRTKGMGSIRTKVRPGPPGIALIYTRVRPSRAARHNAALDPSRAPFAHVQHARAIGLPTLRSSLRSPMGSRSIPAPRAGPTAAAHAPAAYSDARGQRCGQPLALQVGMFATRTPHRPNPIGLSLVKLDRVTPDGHHLRPGCAALPAVLCSTACGARAPCGRTAWHCTALLCTARAARVLRDRYPPQHAGARHQAVRAPLAARGPALVRSAALARRLYAMCNAGGETRSGSAGRARGLLCGRSVRSRPTRVCACDALAAKQAACDAA